MGRWPDPNPYTAEAFLQESREFLGNIRHLKELAQVRRALYERVGDIHYIQLGERHHSSARMVRIRDCALIPWFGP